LAHLAAMSCVRRSLSDLVLHHDVNCTGYAVLLQAAHAAGLQRFVFGSSSSVYGGNEKVPFHEDDDVSGPVSPYAATKRANELTCHVFSHLYGMDIACLRFFTVYGPRQRPEMAIHKFVRLLERGEKLPLYGDGRSERDYTYVDDILDGVVKALDRSKGYRIYNLGESRTVSLKELVAAIGRATGKEPGVEWQPAQPGDVPRTFADIGRARAELGYDPRVGLEEGLRRFVGWDRGPEGAAARGEGRRRHRRRGLHRQPRRGRAAGARRAGRDRGRLLQRQARQRAGPGEAGGGRPGGARRRGARAGRLRPRRALRGAALGH